MFGATYATLDEAWGPSNPQQTTSTPSTLATTPPFSNPYKDQSYQRQILNNASSVGITPREPQVLDAGTVKSYLATLYKDSGPVAVSSLLPAEYLRAPPRDLPAQTVASLPREYRTEYREHRRGSMFASVEAMFEDPETLMILLLTMFGLYMVTK